MDTGFADLLYLGYVVPAMLMLCRTYGLLRGRAANAIMPIEGNCPQEVLF